MEGKRQYVAVYSGSGVLRYVARKLNMKVSDVVRVLLCLFEAQLHELENKKVIFALSEHDKKILDNIAENFLLEKNYSKLINAIVQHYTSSLLEVELNAISNEHIVFTWNNIVCQAGVGNSWLEELIRFNGLEIDKSKRFVRIVKEDDKAIVKYITLTKNERNFYRKRKEEWLEE